MPSRDKSYKGYSPPRCICNDHFTVKPTTNPSIHVVLSWKNLHACMRRHSTCPKNRVNLRPTTQCKCQWEINIESVPTPISQPIVYVIFIYLFRVFLSNRTFRGLTAGLLHPPTFFGLSPVDTLSNQVFRLFTRGGYLSPTCYARHISFSIFV